MIKIQVIEIPDVGFIVKKLIFDNNGRLISKFGLNNLTKAEWVRVEEGRQYPIRSDVGGYVDSENESE